MVGRACANRFGYLRRLRILSLGSGKGIKDDGGMDRWIRIRGVCFVHMQGLMFRTISVRVVCRFQLH